MMAQNILECGNMIKSMEKEQCNILMVIFILVNLKMEKDMEVDSINIAVIKMSMLVILFKIINKELAPLLWAVEMNILGNGKEGKKMEKEYINFQMVMYTKVNLKIVEGKDMAFINGLMEPLIRDNGKAIK